MNVLLKWQLKRFLGDVAINRNSIFNGEREIAESYPFDPGKLLTSRQKSFFGTAERFVEINPSEFGRLIRLTGDDLRDFLLAIAIRTSVPARTAAFTSSSSLRELLELVAQVVLEHAPEEFLTGNWVDERVKEGAEPLLQYSVQKAAVRQIRQSRAPLPSTAEALSPPKQARVPQEVSAPKAWRKSESRSIFRTVSAPRLPGISESPQKRSEGFPSWGDDPQEFSGFLQSVRILAGSAGVGDSFVNRCIRDDSDSVVLRRMGALEKQGKTYMEQVDAAVDYLKSEWNRLYA